MNNSPNHSPGERVVVMGYEFQSPHIPTEAHVEQAEDYVFTRPEFLEIIEYVRRRNVFFLASATTVDIGTNFENGERLQVIVPLCGELGEVTVSMMITEKEGQRLVSYGEPVQSQA